MIHCNINIL